MTDIVYLIEVLLYNPLCHILMIALMVNVLTLWFVVRLVRPNKSVFTGKQIVFKPELVDLYCGGINSLPY